jgi:nucleotide-binding universal stress UspA family protein
MRVIELIRRLRDEFTTMPGLRLTEPQVGRLCTADASTSASALRALVSAGFLRAMPDGTYRRTDLGTGAPADPLHAGRAPIVSTPWRRILCVVDLDHDGGHALSPAAYSALRYATTLAVTHRARVTALQVVSQPPSTPAPRSTEDLRTRVFAEPFRGLLDVLHVATGAPDEEIIRVARDIDAGLIVIGRDADGGESWPGLSETLRRAPCPVLIVHPSGRAAVA